MIHMLRVAATALAVAAYISGAAAQCNPMKTYPCTPMPGFTSDYSVDFTTVNSLPSDWIVASGTSITFGADGIAFAWNKLGDAPYIWTNNYMWFGTAEVVMKINNGTGVISSAVLYADDLDEIDWEFSGNDFNLGGPGHISTNYFGNGITGSYDRATQPKVAFNPRADFHTYTFDWSPTQLVWKVDGTVIRTLLASSTDNAEHQYPQTPARFHLGLWDAGGSDQYPGTQYWAGGATDMKGGPYIAHIKSVKIHNMNPGPYYQYTDKSGSASAVKIVNSPGTTTTSNSVASKTTSVGPMDYVGTVTPSPTQSPVASNCDFWYFHNKTEGCYDISTAHGIALSDFLTWNPAVGPDCYNLWFNYWTCVGVSDSGTTTAASDAASTSNAAPANGQGNSMPGPMSTTDSSDETTPSSTAMDSSTTTDAVSADSINTSTASVSGTESTSLTTSSTDGASSTQPVVSSTASASSVSATSDSYGPATSVVNVDSSDSASSSIFSTATSSASSSSSSLGSSSVPSTLSASSTLSSSGSSSAPTTTTSSSAATLSPPLTSTLPGSTSTTAPSSPTSSSIPAACPASDKLIVPAISNATSAYKIECGVDRPYGDLSNSKTSSLQACIDKCETTAGCTNAAWLSDSTLCYLKKSLMGTVANAVVCGAVRQGGAAVSAASTVSAGSVSTGSGSSSSGASLPPASLYSSSSAPSSSTAPATSTSAATSASTTTSLSSTNAPTTSTSSPSTSASASTAPTCPTASGTTFTTPSNTAYKIECALDHPGNDLTSSSKQTYTGCLALCDANAKCAGAVWRVSDGNCWLKSSMPAPGYANSGMWGGVRVGGASADSSSSFPVCPANNSAVYTTTGTPSNAYKVECGVDHPGNDIGTTQQQVSYTSCLALCDANAQCAGAVWRTVDGNCWLKSAMPAPGSANSGLVGGNRAAASGAAASASASATSSTAASSASVPSSTSTAPSCPAASNTLYTSPSNTYKIECYIDRPGNDITSTAKQTYTSCLALCDANTKCAVAVWRVSDGSCWIKSSVGSVAGYANSGMWGGVRQASVASSSTTSKTSSTGGSVAQPVAMASTTATTTAAAQSSTSSVGYKIKRADEGMSTGRFGTRGARRHRGRGVV